MPRKKMSKPRGSRTHAAPDLSRDLAAELGETMRIEVAGRTVVISRQRAILRTVMAAAVAGDIPAAALLLGLSDRLLAPAPKGEEESTAEDQALLNDYVAKLARDGEGESEEGSSS